jgi:tRNA(Arg) A34 adenosine deaminase TadA
MNRLPARRVVIAGAAAAAALAALKKPAQAQTVTPAELAKHEKYMRLAIAQAHRNPGRPFGSVIVDERTGEVVGEGVVNMGANPMYHSEIVAMNDYIAKHGNKGWENLTMYGTGEACPMCMSAMVWAGIPRMVYGSDTPFVRQFVPRTWSPRRRPSTPTSCCWAACWRASPTRCSRNAARSAARSSTVHCAYVVARMRTLRNERHSFHRLGPAMT